MKNHVKDSIWLVGGVFLLGGALWMALNYSPPAEKLMPVENAQSVKEAGVKDEGSLTIAPSANAENMMAKSEQQPPVLTDEQIAEGSDTKGFDGNHPGFTAEEKIERGVFVPVNVKGKWKSVKILVKNKQHEELNEVKTLELGSSFTLDDGKLKVTVGPYFPNFVMDGNIYTSMDNVEWNPAVQLVVEENGQVTFKGWSFKKFPSMYAFEHENYSLELISAIPMETS